MSRVLPYPLLGVALVLMWLLLAGFTPGQFVLAILVAGIAMQGLRAIGEESPALRRWFAIPRLVGLVFIDVLRSNMAVAGLVLAGHRRPRRSGFVRVQLRLRNPTGLAVLAVILTSTPGSAWLDYNLASGELLIHVFDLVDEATWVELIGHRYERLLLEIFE